MAATRSRARRCIAWPGSAISTAATSPARLRSTPDLLGRRAAAIPVPRRRARADRRSSRCSSAPTSPRPCCGRCTPSPPTIAASPGASPSPAPRRRARLARERIGARSRSAASPVSSPPRPTPTRSRASRRSSRRSSCSTRLPLALGEQGPGLPLHRARTAARYWGYLVARRIRARRPGRRHADRVPDARGHAHRLGEQLRRPPRRQPLADGCRLRRAPPAPGSTRTACPGSPSSSRPASTPRNIAEPGSAHPARAEGARQPRDRRDRREAVDRAARRGPRREHQRPARRPRRARHQDRVARRASTCSRRRT